MSPRLSVSFTLVVYKLVIFIQERYHLAPEALTLGAEDSVGVTCDDLLTGCPKYMFE